MGERYVESDGVLVRAGDVDVGLALTEVRQLIDRTQELVGHASNVPDATLLVRRSNAAVKLVPEALKACRALEEEQFQIKQDAAVLHLRTQRKAGELLSQMARNRGGRPVETARMGETVRTVQGVNQAPPTLKELGITTYESHRWQLIASIPDDRFEEYIANSNERHREITTRGAVSIARRLAGGGEGNGSGDLQSVSAMPEVEVESVRRRLSDLVWLNPVEVASVLAAGERRLLLEDVKRLHSWLKELEAALAI